MESYSRVLESLAFNIVARIDDLVYVDDLTKHSDQPFSMSKVGMIAHRGVVIVPPSNTPYKTAFTTPSFSPALRPSPATVERSPILENKLPHRGFGVKKVLTDYLSIDAKGKDLNKQNIRSDSSSSTYQGSSASQSLDCSDFPSEVKSPLTHDSPSEE